jgi:hypothetical protein
MRYTMFSAGQGSFRAAMIDRRRHPDAQYGLVFTDTLYEDADAYRFLIEGAAQVLGRRLNWTVHAEDFPDYRVPADTPIEEYRGNPDWRAMLADLRARAKDAIPELVWLTEGRDPWEIFRDGRFLGNSLVDPCSRIGKRELADAWRIGNCSRIGELFAAPDHFAVGIGDHEGHRFDDKKGGGLGPRMAEDGWLYHAPLMTECRPGEESLFFAPLEAIGPAAPRLYGMGYTHNNCGGFCIKAGQAHWANRFKVSPGRFAYDAMMERKMGAFIGKPVSMLTDRRGGMGKKPMTLDAFAERLRREPNRRYEYQPGESGCGCMTDVAA